MSDVFRNIEGGGGGGVNSWEDAVARHCSVLYKYFVENTLLEICQQQRSNDRNRPMAEKKSRNLNYDADFVTIFRIGSVSK
jgi:hypothetical protein